MFRIFYAQNRNRTVVRRSFRGYRRRQHQFRMVNVFIAKMSTSSLRLTLALKCVLFLCSDSDSRSQSDSSNSFFSKSMAKFSSFNGKRLLVFFFFRWNVWDCHLDWLSCVMFILCLKLESQSDDEESLVAKSSVESTPVSNGKCFFVKICLIYFWLILNWAVYRFYLIVYSV